MNINVLICCDKAILGAGLHALLERYRLDVRVETSVCGAVAAATTHSPDVLVVVSPVLTIDNRSELTELAQLSRLLLLVREEKTHRAFDALQAGAHAVLSVESSVEELVRTIRIVVEMNAMVVPAAARGSLHNYACDQPSTFVRSTAESLTPREVEVLMLLTEGRSNADIADKLSVSNTTIRSHVHHVLRKLDAGTRAQAVALAYESGLLRIIQQSAYHSLQSAGPCHSVDHDYQRQDH